MPPVAVVFDGGDGLVIVVCFIVVNKLCCSSVRSFSGIVAVVAFVVVFVVVSCGCGGGEGEGETLD